MIPMEAVAASVAAVAAAARGVSLQMPSSQPSRKEWRIVSEQSVRNLTNEVWLFTEPTHIVSFPIKNVRVSKFLVNLIFFRTWSVRS